MRERTITRTSKTTVYTVLCLDIETQDVKVETFSMTSSTLKTEADKLKYINENLLTDNLRAVAIKGEQVEERLYSLSEDDFIKYARVIPNRKVYNKEEN